MSEIPTVNVSTPLTGTSGNRKVIALLLAIACFALGFAFMDVVNDRV